MDWIVSQVRAMVVGDVHTTLQAHAASIPVSRKRRRGRSPSPEVRPASRAKTNTAPTPDVSGPTKLEIAHMLQ